MRLRYLDMENIRSYLRQRIDFPLSTILFAGDIGSGKSSVLLAIEFALFGTLRGEISGTDILRHGKDSGFVELCFDAGNSSIIIHRNLRRGKNGIVQDAGWVSVNGERLHKTPQEMRAFVLEKLGYPQEYLTKNPVMYRYTVYTPQDSMKSIISEKTDARVSVLRKLFGIDKYSIIRSNSQTLLTELRAMRREALAASAGLDEKKSLREKSLLEISRIKRSAEAKSAELEQVKKKAGEMEISAKQMQEEMRSLLGISGKCAALEAQASAMQRRNASILAELDEIRRRTGSFADILEPKPPPESAEDVAGEKESAEKNMKKCISEISVLESEISKLKMIVSEGRCEFCGQPVADKEHFSSEIEARESMKVELKKAEEESKSRIRQAESKEKLIADYRHALRLYERNLEEKKMLEGRVKSLQNEMAGNSRFMEESAEQLRSMRQQLQKLPQLEAAEKAAASELRIIQENKLRISSELSSLKATLSSLEASVEQYSREIREKQQSLERSGNIAGIASWMETLFIPLMERMEQTVMRSIQQDFNAYLQEWFSVLMGDESISVSVDRDFTPLIEQQGYSTEYSNLSGGEKTAVALAYRLALNKVINSLVETIRTKDLIILDEPTDGFSYEQLDRIRDVLQALGLGQMIIVSHEPKIDTFVDNVIRFYKEGHVSRAVAE